MERIVSLTRPRQAPRLVTIMPAADGWRMGGLAEAGSARLFRTLTEVADAVPPGVNLRLCLPVSAVLMERMRLPATDPEELGGMVILQLEKTLPYGGEELTSGFEMIHQEKNESDLLAVAVSNEQLDLLCEPLRSRGEVPDEVTIFAIQLAAKFPGEEVLAMIYREADATILAVAEKGKLVAAHVCPATTRQAFLAELPRLLLAVELEGTPVNFTRLAVEVELAGWVDGLKEQFGPVPILSLSTDGPLDPGPVNLVPAAWTHEQEQRARKAKVRDWLVLAGMLYLICLLLPAAYIIWLQREVASYDAKVVAATPSVDAIGKEKARWGALQAAIDPTRFTVEILQQVNKSIPSPDLHVTVFNQTPAQFMVEGEAPTANTAVQYADALRANPDLKDFRFEAGPPEMLPGEHAHFRIFGKL